MKVCGRLSGYKWTANHTVVVIISIEFYYIYVTNEQIHIDKICLSYISTYQQVSVASATIIGVSYRNTNNIQTVAQNVQLKPAQRSVNILSAPYGHKMSNYVIVTNR